MKAENVSVRIGRKQILRDVDFLAEPGQVTAIIGPNGSGKSTLLGALSGDIPYTGRITLNGLDIAALQPWELAEMRGVLPQSSAVALPSPRWKSYGWACPVAWPTATTRCRRARWRMSILRGSSRARTRTCPAASSNACSLRAF